MGPTKLNVTCSCSRGILCQKLYSVAVCTRESVNIQAVCLVLWACGSAMPITESVVDTLSVPLPELTHQGASLREEGSEVAAACILTTSS